MVTSTCWQQTTTESRAIISGVFDTNCDLLMLSYLADAPTFVSGEGGLENTFQNS